MGSLYPFQHSSLFHCRIYIFLDFISYFFFVFFFLNFFYLLLSPCKYCRWLRRDVTATVCWNTVEFQLKKRSSARDVIQSIACFHGCFPLSLFCCCCCCTVDGKELLWFDGACKKNSENKKIQMTPRERLSAPSIVEFYFLASPFLFENIFSLFFFFFKKKNQIDHQEEINKRTQKQKKKMNYIFSFWFCF